MGLALPHVPSELAVQAVPEAGVVCVVVAFVVVVSPVVLVVSVGVVDKPVLSVGFVVFLVVVVVAEPPMQ